MIWACFGRMDSLDTRRVDFFVEKVGIHPPVGDPFQNGSCGKLGGEPPNLRLNSGVPGSYN